MTLSMHHITSPNCYTQELLNRPENVIVQLTRSTKSAGIIFVILLSLVVPSWQKDSNWIFIT